VNVSSDGSFTNLVFPVPTRIDDDFKDCGTGSSLTASPFDARVAHVGLVGTDFEIINSNDTFSSFATIGTVYFGLVGDNGVIFYYANKAVVVNGTCTATATNLLVPVTWNNVTLSAGWNYLVVTTSNPNSLTVTGTSLPLGTTFTFTGDASKLGVAPQQQ
jgi:archaellum component FlaG (FlaF/FlaG flagellin family)